MNYNLFFNQDGEASNSNQMNEFDEENKEDKQLN